MKKTYHWCLSAGNTELLCRTKSDYIRQLNCLGLSAYRTDSSLLAYSAMSNHIHICLRTEHLEEFSRSFRYMYSRYFNAKYSRVGRLGERTPFHIELVGLYHTIAAISYVLRNPLHHGICATPFGYEYSSINAVFRKSFGQIAPADVLYRKVCNRFLPEGAVCPSEWRMNKSGLFLSECMIDVTDVEHMFSTPRSYLYYMNRLSGDKWEKEQMRDNSASMPITLSDIEPGIGQYGVQQMLANESGRFNTNTVDDIRVCELICDETKKHFAGKSVYELTRTERVEIAERLRKRIFLPDLQLRRCLVL